MGGWQQAPARIGWLLALIPVAAIPLGAIHHIFSFKSSDKFLSNLINGFKPTKSWRQNAELNTILNKNYSTSTIGIIGETYATTNLPLNGTINPAFISNEPESNNSNNRKI